MSGEDFAVSLDQERHDLAVEAQQVADDAVEASPGRAVAVALDAMTDATRTLTDAHQAWIDADIEVTRARRRHRAAVAAYRAALDAEARS